MNRFKIMKPLNELEAIAFLNRVIKNYQKIKRLGK
jgi:hypothetical protein